MLVVDYKAGQLANRLFLFSYFMGTAIENNIKLINPCFEEYRNLFTATAENNFNNLKVSVTFSTNKFINSFITNSIEKIRAWAKKNNGQFLFFEFHNIKQEYDVVHKEFDMNDAGFIQKAKSNTLFVKGWNYRDKPNLQKHAQAIRNIFTPLSQYTVQIQNLLQNCREKGDTIIGVHIRRGDYKGFFDGRWYYEDNVYYSRMKEVSKIFEGQGKKCVFLVCSNEVINLQNFTGLTLVCQPRDAIIDLYSLAACDYIIGPPSTFSMWASFYGNTPLYVIRNPQARATLEAFTVMQGVESFF